MELVIYKVSEDKNDRNLADESPQKKEYKEKIEKQNTITTPKNFKTYMPSTFEVVNFNVSSLLYRTLFKSEDQYLYWMMPLILKFEKHEDRS